MYMCIYLGKTSLIKTAQMGYIESYDEALELATAATMKILLEHGADVNAKDENGELHTIIFTIFIYSSIHLLSHYLSFNPSISHLENNI